MTTEELHERLRGIQGCWDQALADLQEVSGGLEAIIMTPGENDHTLIQTAKLNNVDPQAWLADVLARIADTTQTQLAELLPWKWQSELLRNKAA